MKNFIIGLLLLVMVGCSNSSPEPEISTQQMRHITTKEFNGTYAQVMKATATVFKDEGYVIKNTNYNTGLIYGEKGTTVKLTASVYEVTAKISEVRFNAQKASKSTSKYGDSMGKFWAVTNPNLYNSFFEQITIELERIKARQ